MDLQKIKKPAAAFSNLIEKSFASILDNKKNFHLYEKKQVLFYEGNPISGIYCIQSGRVKIYKTGPEGKQHILYIAELGDVLGLESIFASDHFTSTAEMIEKGMVGFIEKPSFFEFLQCHPEATFQVLRILAKEVLSNEDERVDLAQSSVRERMARLLSLLSTRYGVPVNNGIRINLQLSREEMADMIGTAVETAVRLLKELKEENVVDLEGKHIVVLNKKQLSHLTNHNHRETTF